MTVGALHPSGTHIVFRQQPVHQKLNLIVRGESADTERLIETSLSSFANVAFSPDGRMIAARSTQDSFVGVWDVATGRELFLIRGHRHYVTSIAFSPDSEHLAVGCAGGRIAIWDVSDLGR
jgi:WD40 repeat protein